MSDLINATVMRLHRELDLPALREFDEFARLCLRRAMDEVGMKEYPNPVDDHLFFSRAGDSPCPVCGKPTSRHPLDWRVIGYGNVPFLNILCNGQRVKL